MEKKQCTDESVTHQTESKCITKFVNSTSEIENRDDTNSIKIEREFTYKPEIIWGNVMGMIIIHSMSAYGIYLIFTSASIWTTIWGFFVGYLGGFGVSAGSHRLWSHKAYKATLPMKIFLMILHTISNEDTIYQWARDHRLHHKYTDSNADPYNIKRGVFFAHMGWLMVRRHPDIKKFGKGIDLSDLKSDPVVQFQKKYFYIIMPIFNFIIPTLIPVYFWNESFKVAFFISVWKWVTSLHAIWTINSINHIWGYKPYDGSNTATDNAYTTLFTLGEGWHNYHHAFPWDYKVPEVSFYFLHPTAKLLEFFALFGLIYDLKTVSPDLARKQANRSGDGTVKEYAISTHTNNDNFTHTSTVWGWDDMELRSDDRNGSEIRAFKRPSTIQIAPGAI